MVDGTETTGQAGGNTTAAVAAGGANDTISQIVLTAGQQTTGYHFGELRTVTPVPMSWYLASSATRGLLFQERIASVEATAGNAELAARIRAVAETNAASVVSVPASNDEAESESSAVPSGNGEAEAAPASNGEATSESEAAPAANGEETSESEAAPPSVEPNPISAEGEASTNPVMAYDTNFDGVLSPADALVVINELNGAPRGSGKVFTDVNADGSTTPMDALMVLNELAKAKLSAEGEGAFPTPADTPVVGSARDVPGKLSLETRPAELPMKPVKVEAAADMATVSTRLAGVPVRPSERTQAATRNIDEILSQVEDWRDLTEPDSLWD
jgi:hypothetical protein